MKSWKTTVAGISTVLITILTLIVNPLVDNDPNTVPKFDESIPIIVAGLIGVFAKDQDVKENKNA
jgi:hypothetical protein